MSHVTCVTYKEWRDSLRNSFMRDIYNIYKRVTSESHMKSDVSHGTCVTYNSLYVTSHMNESRYRCHAWMSWVTFGHVVSYPYVWRHIRMSCVTYEWVKSHVNKSRCIWKSRVIIEWVSSHEWVASHMYESRCIWKSRVIIEWISSHMNKSRCIWKSRVIIEWISSHEWVSSHMYESRHICMRHVTREDRSRGRVGQHAMCANETQVAYKSSRITYVTYNEVRRIWMELHHTWRPRQRRSRSHKVTFERKQST